MNEIKRILRAGGYALDGLVYLMKNEKNSRILLAVAALILIICPLIGFSALQTVIVFLALIAALVAEVLNTAIEIALDLIVNGEYHPKVKIGKDIAACTVLLCIVTSIVIFSVFLVSNLLGR